MKIVSSFCLQCRDFLDIVSCNLWNVYVLIVILSPFNLYFSCDGRDLNDWQGAYQIYSTVKVRTYERDDIYIYVVHVDKSVSSSSANSPPPSLPPSSTVSASTSSFTSSFTSPLPPFPLPPPYSLLLKKSLKILFLILFKSNLNLWLYLSLF